jgi:cytochrome d ubiquinol oxidase subunit II
MLIYLLLDGFDLGVGMLFGLTRSSAARATMLNTIAPVWDGNETWLIVSGVILWGAFPLAYATLMSAFYIPVIIMLLGLILRGVAFEFRGKTERLRWIWDLSFVGGSLIASFMQGATVGALVEGLQFANGQYSGGRSVGSARSRCCAASGCVLATRCSARAGWSENATRKFWIRRAGKSRVWPLQYWYSW